MHDVYVFLYDIWNVTIFLVMFFPISPLQQECSTTGAVPLSLVLNVVSLLYNSVVNKYVILCMQLELTKPELITSFTLRLIWALTKLEVPVMVLSGARHIV